MTAAVVGAAVQIFDGVGEWHTNDDDNQQIAMARAQQRAQIDAQKKAGVALQNFSRSVNARITDEEISAVTNNIIELVGEVHFDKKIIQLSDRQTTILYTATLKAKIDPEGIYDYIKRDEKEKVTIIQQNDNLQDAIQKNDELAEKLTEQYNKATSQAEKERIRKQMNDADRDFLANQKFEEGNKLYYAKDYNEAIKLYDEVLKFGDYVEAYNNRGLAYFYLGQKERAIADYNKAIQLNPNDADAYNNRGNAYFYLGQHERAIKDYTKSIELNNSELHLPYNNRGNAYSDLGQHERAIADYNKAIQLNPNYAKAYYNRGIAYALTGNFNQALNDVNKAIQLEPNNANNYQLRGMIYQALGDNAKAQADFAKAKQLGYNG